MNAYVISLLIRPFKLVKLKAISLCLLIDIILVAIFNSVYILSLIIQNRNDTTLDLILAFISAILIFYICPFLAISFIVIKLSKSKKFSVKTLIKVLFILIIDLVIVVFLINIRLYFDLKVDRKHDLAIQQSISVSQKTLSNIM